MPTYDFEVVAGEVGKTLEARLYTANHTLVDLSAALAVTFIMTDSACEDDPIIDNETATPFADQENDRGKVSYRFSEVGVSTPGVFQALFRVEFPLGVVQFYPTKPMTVLVRRSLG